MSCKVKTDNEPMRAISPEIVLIQEPEVKYILAVETSADMGDRDNWKWVNKAVQKLIRYDLPTNTQVFGVLTKWTQSLHMSIPSAYSAGQTSNFLCELDKSKS